MISVTEDGKVIRRSFMTRIIEVIRNRCLINGINISVESFLRFAANGTAIGRHVAAGGTEGKYTRNENICMTLSPTKIFDLEIYIVKYSFWLPPKWWHWHASTPSRTTPPVTYMAIRGFPQQEARHSLYYELWIASLNAVESKNSK